MGKTKGNKNKRKYHKWTNEEKEYLVSIVKGRTYKEITYKMNKKFDYNFTEEQVKGIMTKNKLTTGTLGYFKKGVIPWNKGLSYMPNNKETRFQKGNIPHTHRKVGSERVNRDGYIEIKVAEPNVWDLKHRVIYEKYHGEIPKDYVVIFADGNKMNLDIDNLILVSRHQLLVLNKNELIKDNGDLTKSGVNVANLIIKLSEIKNGI